MMKRKVTATAEQECEKRIPGGDPAKGNPFVVPEGYFDMLPSGMSELILKKVKSRSGRIVSLPVKAWAPALVAAVFVIAVIIFVPLNRRMNYRAAGDVKDDASGIGYAYDASYAMDVRSAEHLDLYDAIESMGLIPVAEQIMSDTLIGNDDIIDYLADQELDSELLAEM